MKAKKIASRTETPENEDVSADTLEMEKQRLKRDILELQTLISRVEEQDADVTKFSELASAATTLPTAREIQTPSRLPDLDVVFRHEIYSYLGLYCVKSTKNEYVFNFAASGSGDETFSVQIWSRDGKVSLGNWVMPMSVDVKKLHEKTPIESLAMVIPFLKNCKQQVDCYGERKSQFEALKNYVSATSNCELDANLGFTLVKLRLLGVYSKPGDSYVDLTIELSYKSSETRPCAVAVDWSLRKDPSQQQESEMKSYAKFLKNQRLLNGFRHMTESTHPVYSWAMEEYVNSPLELNNSGGSEEEEWDGSLLIAAKRKRNRLTVRRRKDRELRDRWRKRQRLTTIVARSPDGNSTDEENEEPTIDNRSSAETRTRSAVRSINRQPTDPKSAVDKIAESKIGRKLRQSTINFEARRSSEAEETNPRSPKTTKKSVGKTERKSDSAKSAEKSVSTKIKPGILSAVKSGMKSVNRAASTPLQREARGKVKFAAIGDMAISPIASAGEN